MPHVILVHGFHRHASDLASMGHYLEQRGFQVWLPELPTTTGRLASCARLLQEYYLEHASALSSDVHLVGHSYGGLILREFLACQAVASLASLTCFGSSHHGSRIADWLVFLGRSRKEPALLEFRTPGPFIQTPRQGWPARVHLIAGNQNKLWLGRLFLSSPSDGRLPVASALATTPRGVDCGFPPWTQRTVLSLDHHEMMQSTVLFETVIQGIQ